MLLLPLGIATISRVLVIVSALELWMKRANCMELRLLAALLPD